MTPSPKEQKEIIKKLSKETSIQIGQSGAFLISVSWYNYWKEFCNNNDISNESIGPIDNSLLVDSDNVPIYDKKCERLDFYILTPQIWEQLKSWYGGGPEIPIRVIEDKVHGGGLVAIVKFTTLFLKYKDVEQKFKVSRFVELNELIDEAKKKFEIDDSEEIRLLKMINNRIDKKEMDKDKTIDQNTIFNGDHIFIDYKENGKWKSEYVSPEKEIQNKIEQKKPTVISYSNKLKIDINDRCGTSGFSNLGNTCFFNSGLQCLVHTNLLMRYFLLSNWKSELNYNNPIGMHGELATAFAAICNKVWNDNESVIYPQELKYVIGKYVPQFSGFGQQDSHELITFMLDGLHEDLNRCINKPIIDSVSGDGTNDREIADKAWKLYRQRNDSIIVDLFQGQLRSQLTCPLCKNLTVVFDPYMSLPLPISKPNYFYSEITCVFSDFNQSYDKINVSYSKINEIAPQIYNQTGKNVCLFSIPNVKGANFSIFDGNNKKNYFAIEVPDPKKKYIACVLTQKYSETYVGVFQQVMSAPILIEIDSFSNVSKDDIAKKIEKKLSFLWDKNYCHKAPSVQINSLRKSLIFENKDKFKDSSRIILGDPYGDENIHNFVSNSNYDYLANEIVSFFINPNILDDISFPFSTLLQHFYEIFDRSPQQTQNKTITLEDCFEYFSTSEVLGENNKWYCPKCKEFVQAKKKMDIWSVPEILVIQLKRFTAHSKLDNMVEFPDEMDINKYVIGPDDPNKLKYKLYAVSEHMGGLGGGHYTAHAIVSNPFQNDRKSSNWYSFNDSSTHKVDSYETHSKNAYILFYERIHEE